MSAWSVCEIGWCGHIHNIFTAMKRHCVNVSTCHSIWIRRNSELCGWAMASQKAAAATKMQSGATPPAPSELSWSPVSSPSTLVCTNRSLHRSSRCCEPTDVQSDLGTIIWSVAQKAIQGSKYPFIEQHLTGNMHFCHLKSHTLIETFAYRVCLFRGLSVSVISNPESSRPGHDKQASAQKLSYIQISDFSSQSLPDLASTRRR